VHLRCEAVCRLYVVTPERPARSPAINAHRALHNNGNSNFCARGACADRSGNSCASQSPRCRHHSCGETSRTNFGISIRPQPCRPEEFHVRAVPSPRPRLDAGRGRRYACPQPRRAKSASLLVPVTNGHCSSCSTPTADLLISVARQRVGLVPSRRIKTPYSGGAHTVPTL